MNRRGFLKAAAGTSIGALAIDSYWSRALAAVANGDPLPRRPYNSRDSLSIIGFGGIVLLGQEQADADREVARAVDRGVNYFDVAPAYGRGEAERKLGPALAPYRGRVFLADKSNQRDADGCRAELEQSLRVLRSDYFDLYQLHAISTAEDVEKVFAPGGAMETLTRARDEGKVRYLGFSSHDEDVALDLLERFDWDSVLFPINYVCYAQGGFGPRLVARARQKGVARLALKALAHTPWESQRQRNENHPKCWYRPIADLDKARAALRFTLSEDVTSAIPPGDQTIYRIAENLGSQIKPLTPAERESLLASTAGLEPIFAAA